MRSATGAPSLLFLTVELSSRSELRIWGEAARIGSAAGAPSLLCRDTSGGGRRRCSNELLR